MGFTFKLYAALLLLTCTLLQESSGNRCTNAPDVFSDCPQKEVVVKEGSQVVLKCSTKVEQDFCSWISPAGESVRPLRNDPHYVAKSDASKKNCDLTIKKVKEDENGEWVCAPFLKNQPLPERVTGTLIVAMAKSPPRLSYTYHPRTGPPKLEKDPQILKVDANKRLEVSCKIPSARPAANSKWYLIDGKGRKTDITRDADAREPMPSDGPDDTLKDRLSILTKTFNHYQNGYRIRCEMSHLAAEPGKVYAEAKLEISFKPFFPEGKEMRIFELNEQHKGEGTIQFRAHPQPRPGTQIQLRVDDKDIVQPGSSKKGYSITTKSVPSAGDDTYEVTITAENIRKEDEKTKLVFFVENELGTDTVEVRFSSDGALGGLSGGVVAGIVVAAIILVLILVGILIARRKHLCSSDSEAQEKEGDTESTGEQKNQTISDRFNKFCNSLVKPNKNKEDDLEKGGKEETAPIEEKPVDKPEPGEPDADSIKKEDPMDEKLPPPPPPVEENVVYAELDLKEGGSPPRKSSQDTTEYAEIVGTVKSSE